MNDREFAPCTTLRELRQKRELTQAALARLLIKYNYCLDSRYISRFETGLSRPWPAARRAIAIVLEVAEEDLFPEINS